MKKNNSGLKLNKFLAVPDVKEGVMHLVLIIHAVTSLSMYGHPTDLVLMKKKN